MLPYIPYMDPMDNDLMNNHCEALIAHPCSSSFEDAFQFPDAKCRQQCLQAMACDPAPQPNQIMYHH